MPPLTPTVPPPKSTTIVSSQPLGTNNVSDIVNSGSISGKTIAVIIGALVLFLFTAGAFYTLSKCKSRAQHSTKSFTTSASPYNKRHPHVQQPSAGHPLTQRPSLATFPTAQAPHYALPPAYSRFPLDARSTGIPTSPSRDLNRSPRRSTSSTDTFKTYESKREGDDADAGARIERNLALPLHHNLCEQTNFHN